LQRVAPHLYWHVTACYIDARWEPKAVPKIEFDVRGKPHTPLGPDGRPETFPVHRLIRDPAGCILCARSTVAWLEAEWLAEADRARRDRRTFRLPQLP
jgi:hypothetical protein